MIGDYISSSSLPPKIHAPQFTSTSGVPIQVETSLTSSAPPPVDDGFRVATPEEESPQARGKVRAWFHSVATTAVLTWAALTHTGTQPASALAAQANVAAHNVALSGPVAAAVTITVEASQPCAFLPGGVAAPPSSYSGGFHGTCEVSPEVALEHGLPRRGGDWRLYEHAVAAGDSAFRGTTQVVYDFVSGGGAAAWAGDGGWVYDVRGVPTWDVNGLLEGRVARAAGGFTGNLMYGENEYAIPAEIPPHKIKRYGKVVEDQMGRLRVMEWVDNPNFKP